MASMRALIVELAGCAAAIVTSVSVPDEPLQPADVDRVLKGKDAFGDWRADAPGVRRLITPDDLPPISKDQPDESKVVPMPAGATPKVPPGFTVHMIASGLAQPRAIRTAPNGDLFVANSKANEIRIFRATTEGVAPATGEVFVSGLHKPFGMVFYPPGPEPEWIYIANTDSVVRFPYRNGDQKASGASTVIVDHLPSSHHWTRDIAVTPDGAQMYLSIGSGSNVALDMFPTPKEGDGLAGWKQNHPVGEAWDTEERRAVVITFDPSGQNQQIFATGLRNAAGITVQPATGDLWAVVNERDGLGNDTPLEFAAHVQQGAFYGWPWYFNGAHEDPRHPGARPDLKQSVAVPDVLLQAHTAPLQIAFYNAQAFPPEYRGDAFVTMHGSWDRTNRVGYKVVRLRFDKDGKPTGEYEDFMTGFVVSDSEVWGRPVGVTVGADGSLYVTEDGNGTIWRISYEPTRQTGAEPISPP